MCRYIVHVVDRKTQEEGYIARGKLVSMKLATSYSSPSNARQAILTFGKDRDITGTVVDRRSLRT